MENATVRYEPISVGQWIVTLIISMIPLVNIVMMFVWALGTDTHPSKANWAKAYLIFIASFVVLYALLFFAIGMNQTSAGF